MTTTTQADTTPEQVDLSTLVRRHGARGPGLIVPAPVHLQGDDAFEAAWNYATLKGGRYVEGTCKVPGAPGRKVHTIFAHAWVEKVNVIGAQVIECVRGFDESFDYRGIPVDLPVEPGCVLAAASMQDSFDPRTQSTSSR